MSLLHYKTLKNAALDIDLNSATDAAKYYVNKYIQPLENDEAN